MSSLNLKNIYKVYPSGVTAVTDFNLDIEDKEFIVFVGPSGCGKSTTLRMIAGLEEISAGELYIDGVLVNNRAPKDRDIAMVFQNYALYPHMTVYDNMAFGLKLRKMPKPQIDQRVKEAARILGIEMYLSRKPKALSGGQRQRVALGRAIVREPKVFLLDEPLSNLDAKLRSQMRTEITKLHNRLATTFIYVTHDQVEAMTMGTRIVVMKDGFMQQVDTPINLYDHPINQFVAGFIGTPQMNFFTGKLTGDDKNVYLEFGLEKIALPKEKVDLICNLDKYLNTDREIVFGIRPEDIHDEEAWISNKKNAIIEVKVDVVEALGSETLLYCKTRSEQAAQAADSVKSIVDDVSNLTAKVDSRSISKAGDDIKIALDIVHCHLFDKETEVTILARSQENKAEIEALQAKRQAEEAEKAAANAAKLAEEEAKAAAEAEKQRIKMEKKLAKKNAKNIEESAEEKEAE
ncbi:MAG: sn-glycerol-3-phosphate ABC transporter ATP-binding protein UgpC [Clostridiales bacterium]|nr:sn-glycerol-3-phosphate ABC transporter ATP-binding protein UgpC [Clostridiales bacterium]